MVNCERCKQKITLSNIYIDEETGLAKKYCRSCAETMKNEGKTEVRTEGKVKNEVKVKDEEKIEMTLKKENEETIQEIAKEVDNLDKPETDIVTRDVLIDRINSYLGEEPLNVKDGDFCYIRVVRNHLEIGRAKIILEE